MKTLADMTEEERKECVGMWVSYQTPMGDHLAVYEGNTTLYEPGYGSFMIPTYCITPLRDKPRAWQADGTPPAGQWEDDYTDTYGYMLSTGQSIGMAPHAHIRRWVGRWEEA